MVTYLVVVVAGLVLLARRRWPVEVLMVVVTLGLMVAIQSGADGTIPAMVAFYTVARAGPRRRHLAVAVVVAVGAAVVLALLGSDGFAEELISELGLLLLPVALGDGARSRDERLQARIEAEAEARVQSERLRIARDLHDVVAHGLSTIAVQSGVAAHLIDRDQEQARQALTIINRTGRSSLEELRSMVGVLRSTEQVPLRPTPSDPNDLDDLLAGAEAAGVAVTVTVDGEFPDDVGEACVVAVHRIIQEALTNVVRHAGGSPATLHLAHGSDRVVVTIDNRLDGPTGHGAATTGVGLIGMTERAESLGGTLVAGPTADGRFEVVATVPYHGRPSAGPEL